MTTYTRLIGLTMLVVGLAITACTGAIRPAVPAAAVQQTQAATPTEVRSAGDVPDNAVFVTYKSGEGGYRIQYVEGWTVKPGANGAVAITDIDSAERVDVRALSPGELQPYIMNTDEAQVKAQTKDYKRVSLKALTVKQRALVALTYTGTSAPDAVTNKTRPITSQRYYMPGPHQRLAILSLTTPDGVDNVDAFQQILESFTWQ